MLNQNGLKDEYKKSIEAFFENNEELYFQIPKDIDMITYLDNVLHQFYRLYYVKEKCICNQSGENDVLENYKTIHLWIFAEALFLIKDIVNSMSQSVSIAKLAREALEEKIREGEIPNTNTIVKSELKKDKIPDIAS